MKFKSLILAGAAIFALAGSAQAQTAGQFSERDSLYIIDLSGGLDSALTTYSVTATLPAGGSDALAYGLNYKSGFQNFGFATTGTVTTDYAAPGAGSTGETGDVFNGGGGGTFKFSYQTPNGPDFSSSWTESTIANGHHVLAFGGIGSQGFGGCGSQFLDIGGVFTCVVEISGNHPEGMATGDAYITHLDPSYGITDNFLYVSAIDTTFVSVGISGYSGVNPGLGINIVGDATVPEPATWAMMLVGFAGLGAAMRRTRRQAVAA